ncbi:MAG: putative glycoside hydrolase, partial [Hydrogenophaga sp.]|nr:putative glycoside hydrolase [Hydrogenophaga sp.]
MKYWLTVILLITTMDTYAVNYESKRDFPKLFGMNIGTKNYDNSKYLDDMSKLDLVILGFYPGWKKSGLNIDDVLSYLKERNPRLLIGQYTILNEAYKPLRKYSSNGDKTKKITRQRWWLTNSTGVKQAWTDRYDAWDVNITSWVKPDENNQTYPEWLAIRDFNIYFKNHSNFDIWYFDNVFWKPRVPYADWQVNGDDESNLDPLVMEAYRNGQRLHWDKASNLAPNRLLIGNTDNDLSYPQYKGALNGAFLEGLMGKSWSVANRSGWNAAMKRYRDALANTANPKIVLFHVFGNPHDYRFFRYAYISCLLDDGYFSFTDELVGYSSVPWFDEYNVYLGKAIDPAQYQPYTDSIYKREFENGLVLVNTSSFTKSVSVPDGYKRFQGQQDPV